MVLRDAPQKLRHHLQVNSQQFESNYNKLRAIIQAYLNTNKTWNVNDFRETDPMKLDYIGKVKSKGKGKSKSKGIEKAATKAKAVENQTTTQSVTYAERRVTVHETAGHEPTTTRW